MGMSMTKRPSKRKTVIVGMTGRCDSTIAAYLLKKQGYQVIGVTLLFGPLAKPNGGDGPLLLDGKHFLGAYHIPDPMKVKKICEQLEIPFYAVNAQDQYQEKVGDFAVAAKIGGKWFEPKLHTTELIFSILLEKGIKLNADYVATGHFAKIIRNQTSRDFHVYVSNDLEHDQSHLLSLLKKEQMERILLPLSEMRSEEVMKVGKLLGIKFGDEDITHHLMTDPKMKEYVEDYAAPSLRPEGEVVTYPQDNTIMEHKGIHQFYLGQKKIGLVGTSKALEKGIIIAKMYSEINQVLVCDEQSLHFTEVHIERFYLDANFDVTGPVECFVRLPNRKETMTGTLYFKTLNRAIFEFTEEQDGILFPGSFVYFYNKAGVGGRLIGGGEVRCTGEWKYERFWSLPPVAPEEDDEENKPAFDPLRLKF